MKNRQRTPQDAEPSGCRDPDLTRGILDLPRGEKAGLMLHIIRWAIESATTRRRQADE